MTHNTNTTKENFDIDTVLDRGVAEVLPDTDSLKKHIGEKKTIRVYLGIDPTGPLLTLGHSIPLRKLQQFAELGHEVILLIGNGTVRIGDPTGKDETRPVLTDEQIEANFQDWKRQASTVLDFDMIEIKHNGDWLDQLDYADMVKLLAQTTVQQLLERDMFQKRIEQERPIHGHEIIYPLLQGYDSVAMDVDLEIGGTDQTFNMMMGRTLQKKYNGHEKWVLVTPIINGLDGRKMSKSYDNYIALVDEADEMYTKLMQINDEMIVEYFELLTDVPTERVREIEKAITDSENPMQFKKELAHTITTMYHDEAAAEAAAEKFASVVQGGEVGDVEAFSFDVAETSEHSSATEASIYDLLKQTPSDRSNSDLRRLIEQGGITVIMQGGEEVTPEDLSEAFALKDVEVIKVGRKEFYKPILD